LTGWPRRPPVSSGRYNLTQPLDPLLLEKREGGGG